MRTRHRRRLAALAVCSALASACGRSEGDLLTPMCGAPSEGAPLPCATTWPNESSQANSDPWLVSHHDGLVSIHPRVLLLHFYNPMTLSEVSTNTDLFLAALAKGSSYQGYAPPFLHYEIAKLVDLTDASPPAGYRFPYSTQFPTMPDGSLDVGALFKDKFANLYQIADPQDPSHNLDLCQLFVRGLVNEVWLHVGEPAPPATTSILERRQIYDDSNHPIPGSFLTTAGTPAQSRALDMVGCPVTVRMVVIVPVTTPRPESQPIGRHVACSLMAHGFGMETASLSVPYLTVHARPFLNLDFRSRFHVPFDGWRDVCTTNFSPCVFYSKEPTTQVWTARAATGAAIGGWNMRPFRQGCGTVDFPPNARFRWDFDNQVADQSVEARCDGYAVGNGPDGGDRYDPYAPDTSGGLEGPFNCAPAWQMHWRQSIPSYRNAAFDIEGRPMKNWWTFLFY